MNRRYFFMAVIFLFSSLLICRPVFAIEDTIFYFDIYKVVEDYGENIDKVVIKTGHEFTEENIQDLVFEIKETTKNNGIPIIPRCITISEVYLANENLEKVNRGHYIILDIEHSFSKQLTTNKFDIKTARKRMLDLSFEININSPLYDANGNALKDIYLIQDNVINPLLDKFEYGSGHNLNYRYALPNTLDEKQPLVIWLHGTGEGGRDNIAHVANNRGGVAFVDPKIVHDQQSYVLAIQTSYNWLLWNYTENIQHVVEDFIIEYPNIDTDRIYIGGCSAGGYQVWKNIIAYPDYYAAAFPVCPAYSPSLEALELVKHIPIWLVHSSKDPIVPVSNSRKAYQRLTEIGGEVIYTELGEIKREGNDYMNHFSWIPMLANEVYHPETGIQIIQWLFQQSKIVQ